MSSLGAFIRIEYLSIETERLILEANFPGEKHVRFHVEAYDSTRRNTHERGWYARPNLLIVSDLGKFESSRGVASALLTERSYRYRPWQSSGRKRDQSETIMYWVDCYGDLNSRSKDRWIDVAIHLSGGDVITLTVETPSDIEYDMRDNESDFYYCPDLLVVREIERELIEQGVASLVNDDIYRYGIVSGSSSIG